MPGPKGEFSWIFFVPMVILLGLTLFFFVKNLRVMFTYERTSGEIVRFESSAIKGGQTVYQTIVQYTKPDGSTQEAGSFTRSNSVSSRIGDKVTVYVNPQNADQAHVHTFRDTWLHVLILWIIGSIIGICWYGILQGVSVSTDPSVGRNMANKLALNNKEKPDLKSTHDHTRKR